MGSLNASGIPVVSKTSDTFRKRGIKISKINSVTDVDTQVTSHRPELSRAIGSGSVVRASGAVAYFEEKAWGVTRMARTTTDRIASDVNATRTRIVNLGDNITDAVIETALQGTTPQDHVAHRGRKIAVANSQTDDFTRVDATGVLG